MDSQFRFSVVSSWNLVYEADNTTVCTTCKFCPSFPWLSCWCYPCYSGCRVPMSQYSVDTLVGWRFTGDPDSSVWGQLYTPLTWKKLHPFCCTVARSQNGLLSSSRAIIGRPEIKLVCCRVSLSIVGETRMDILRPKLE